MTPTSLAAAVAPRTGKLKKKNENETKKTKRKTDFSEKGLELKELKRLLACPIAKICHRKQKLVLSEIIEESRISDM